MKQHDILIRGDIHHSRNSKAPKTMVSFNILNTYKQKWFCDACYTIDLWLVCLMQCDFKETVSFIEINMKLNEFSKLTTSNFEWKKSRKRILRNSFCSYYMNAILFGCVCVFHSWIGDEENTCESYHKIVIQLFTAKQITSYAIVQFISMKMHPKWLWFSTFLMTNLFFSLNFAAIWTMTAAQLFSGYKNNIICWNKISGIYFLIKNNEMVFQHHKKLYCDTLCCFEVFFPVFSVLCARATRSRFLYNRASTSQGRWRWQKYDTNE